MRRYTVVWQRTAGDTQEVQRCTHLTLRQAAARLIGAIRNSGPIIVHSVKAEH